ncbi:hypothetical protein VTH06DRAFT_7935 [Thermothelomyces fergusii]
MLEDMFFSGAKFWEVRALSSQAYACHGEDSRDAAVERPGARRWLKFGIIPNRLVWFGRRWLYGCSRRE